MSTPKEFYAEFHPYFLDKFVEVINNCFTQNLLTPSQREARTRTLKKLAPDFLA
jgi:hypothetical protein